VYQLAALPPRTRLMSRPPQRLHLRYVTCGPLSVRCAEDFVSPVAALSRLPHRLYADVFPELGGLTRFPDCDRSRTSKRDLQLAPASLMGWTQPVFNGFIVSQRWQSGHRRELREGPSVKVTRIGLDIAKQIFELHGVDRRGRVVVRKTLRRERVLEYFSQLAACEVALEACGGAHYWHRELSKLGHSVRLLPTNKVKPYLDGNKNNAHDAAAICEASSRPSMRWVEPKTIAQQDLQSLHRVRQVTVRQCTLLANHMRGLLLEYGIAVARGTAALHRALAALLEPAEQRL